MGKTFHFQVNLGGMLDILSNHLYKTPDVFLRELLQNGADAIALRKKKESGWDKGAIHIKCVPGKKISFSDNGAGLTKEEIHQFLSVIGQSSKHDLMGGQVLEDYIGRFGIGLLSCFMVSDSIVVHTRSTDSSKTYVWEGKPDGTYTLSKTGDSATGDKKKGKDKGIPAGTSITLRAKKGCEDYYQENTITRLVQYYGLMLPVPVYLNDKKDPLNYIPASFTKLGRGKLLSLGEWLFEEDFLDVIPVETEHLSGAVYILPYKTDPAVKSGHRIYLKNMLLTDQGVPLLPEWAFFLRCFLNTSGLRPTASRESFYEDSELELARQEFARAVKQRFIWLSEHDPKILQETVSVHYDAIKSMAVWDDEIFRLFIEYLPFVTSEGKMTGAALRQAGEAVYIGEVSRFEQLKPVFAAQNRLLICSGYDFDGQLIPKFASLYDLPITALHEEDMGGVLQEVPEEDYQHAKELLRLFSESLEEFDCRADLRYFQPDDLPALYYYSDEVEFVRRVQGARESSHGVFSEALASLISDAAEKTLAVLYLNYCSPLIQRLLHMENKDLLKSVARILYIQALATGGHSLHHRELKALSDELLNLVEYHE